MKTRAVSILHEGFHTRRVMPIAEDCPHCDLRDVEPYCRLTPPETRVLVHDDVKPVPIRELLLCSDYLFVCPNCDVAWVEEEIE